jgi:hypothetical protein
MNFTNDSVGVIPAQLITGSDERVGTGFNAVGREGGNGVNQTRFMSRENTTGSIKDDKIEGDSQDYEERDDTPYLGS